MTEVRAARELGRRGVVTSTKGAMFFAPPGVAAFFVAQCLPAVQYPSNQISSINDFLSAFVFAIFSPGDRMKHLSSLIIMAALVSTSLPAAANLELAQKSACMACHAVDKKVLGPAYQDVAKKYAGQKDAVAQLTDSIRKGGSGKWGPIPMPAQPSLSEANAKTLATWVLGGAK